MNASKLEIILWCKPIFAHFKELVRLDRGIYILPNSPNPLRGKKSALTKTGKYIQYVRSKKKGETEKEGKNKG